MSNKATLFMASMTIYIFSLFSIPYVVMAQDTRLCDDPAVSTSAFCRDQGSAGSNIADNSLVGPNGVLTELVTVLSIIVGVASVIVIVIGALLLTVAAGDAGKQKKGRDAIIYALVGLVVAVFARFIIAFVLSRL